jgi:3-deoxy-manno-octulosonate cytidylyltransferase (CMP-KDO synthetase)
LQTIIIIPSRYASQRLPAKPLAVISGMTMVERVYRQCKKATGIDAVYVTTDHPKIADEVNRFGGGVIMTSPDCPSGTDRVAQAAAKLDLSNDDIVINVQGDEPLIDPEVISSLAREMAHVPELKVATPITTLKHAEELTNPNVVFVAKNKFDDALYFSRHPIPFHRELGWDSVFYWPQQHLYYKHIGVYAYRADVLKLFVEFGESPLERAERLEQLRLLENGIPIRCVHVEYESVAVDTAEDIKRVESLL